MKTISETTLRRLLEQIARTQSEELDCGQVYQLLDEFVEHAAHAREAAAIIPLAEGHPGLCPDCHEECEMLLRILKADSPAAYRYAFLGSTATGTSAGFGRYI